MDTLECTQGEPAAKVCVCLRVQYTVRFTPLPEVTEKIEHVCGDTGDSGAVSRKASYAAARMHVYVT